MFERLLGLADLHLTAEPANEYRWELFEWIHKQVDSLGITDVLLCGDISDFKDEHSAVYVNKLVDALARLGKVTRVHWLMGNHDMIKADTPYFEFINHIEGLHYYKEPVFFEDERVLMLPYTKAPASKWLELKEDIADADLIFMHQPCIGSKSSDFYVLEQGLDANYFSKEHPDFKGHVFSGDIHIPQVVGDVFYFGSPHNLRYGDDIETGGYLFTLKGDTYEIERIDTANIRKWHIHIDHPSDLSKYEDKVNQDGTDYIRVTVNFSGDAYQNWASWRKEIEEVIVNDLGCKLGPIAISSKSVDFQSLERSKDVAVEIKSESADHILDTYADREEIDDELLEVGQEIIKETQNKKV